MFLSKRMLKKTKPEILVMISSFAFVLWHFFFSIDVYKRQILWTNYVQNIKIQPMQIHCRQAQPPKFVHGPNGIAARQLSANGPLTPLHKGAKQK